MALTVYIFIGATGSWIALEWHTPNKTMEKYLYYYAFEHIKFSNSVFFLLHLLCFPCCAMIFCNFFSVFGNGKLLSLTTTVKVRTWRRTTNQCLFGGLHGWMHLYLKFWQWVKLLKSLTSLVDCLFEKLHRRVCTSKVTERICYGWLSVWWQCFLLGRATALYVWYLDGRGPWKMADMLLPTIDNG